MRKGKFMVILIMVIALLLLTGCGSEEKNPNEITFWTLSLSPKFDDYIRGAIAEFERQNPGSKIKWVDIPYNDVDKKLLASAAAHTLPDVINLNTEFGQKLAEKNLLVDMKVAAAGVKTDYIAGAWNASEYRGVIYGLPWYLTCGLDFNNRQLLSQAGIDEPPADYSEMLAAARRVKAVTGKYGYVQSGYSWLVQFVKQGVPLFNKDMMEINMHSSEFWAVADWWRQMYQEQLVPPEMIARPNDYGSLIQLYSAGDVAVLEGGTSQARMIQANNAEVAGSTSVSTQLVGGPGVPVTLSVMNLVVPRSSVNAPLAVKFAIFMTNADKQLEFAKIAGSIIPSTVASLQNSFFSDSDGSLSGNAKVQAAHDVVRAEAILPPFKNELKVKAKFINALQQYIMADGTGNREPVERAEKEINELL